MAKQDKATYDSYAPDAFDNPPAGPVGVHRGPRSAGARVAPYAIVLVAAVLVGALTWSLVTGEFSKVTGLGGNTTTTQSSGTTSTSGSGTDSSNGTGSSDSTDGTSSNGTDSSTDSDANSDGSSDSTDSTDGSTSSNGTDNTDNTDNSQSNDQSTQTDQNAAVNKTTSVRVVNAAGINGYAAQKKSSLESAGYTAVEAANPTTTNLPSSTVVWYQSEADKATAQDVASTLGISAVEQVNGLTTPIVVVLRN
ncbi:LytR cell envelope-related transcriptional attenuator [Bifidobacterium hapali]|uniref:LytR cell envelope-related transcriptional attenuator n=1 Tax=Bifidobacterium hapali TaxID=1630172 RepID=A0A261FZD4_9BIFI|nr:LytR C-terminal domain-containing protein [Bifidobacterium hapali]OZG64541.1 LytR cell envelope-related transcriptional attenuator [Bifidobacterium hapali]